MDKLVIEGGVPLAGEIAVSGSKNSALPALAACLLTAEPVILNRIPQVRDIRTMLDLIGHIGARSPRRRRPGNDLRGPDRASRSALRTGQDHASLEPGAGTAGRAVRPGSRIVARWLRHRRASHQSARLRAGATGRGSPPGTRLYRSESSPRSSGRERSVRPHLGHRHRRPADGGRAGARRNCDRERGARAGSG